MEKNKSKNLKVIAIFVWVAVVWAVILLFGKPNPSKSDSKSHLNIMNEDMSFALKKGGDVYWREATYKYGGALLIVNLNAYSWSRSLAGSYRSDLLMRGWVEIEEDDEKLSFCKDGMIAEIYLRAGKDSSRGPTRDIYLFLMSYDGNTIDQCGNNENRKN